MGRAHNILMVYHPLGQQGVSGFRRHYRYIHTALAKALTLAVQSGYVGDVYELADAVSGAWLGALKVTATGEVDARFASEADRATYNTL